MVVLVSAGQIKNQLNKGLRITLNRTIDMVKSLVLSTYNLTLRRGIYVELGGLISFGKSFQENFV
jgi:acetylglutamate kinase